DVMLIGSGNKICQIISAVAKAAYSPKM
ncbi:unnamed protein product, partial [Rotaria magnacalcarata]